MDRGLVQIHTLGCKVNTYDSGLIYERFKNNKTLQEQPIHIINSCAVTEEATKEAIKLARKIKSKNPVSLVIVTGCAAQVDAGLLNNHSSFDLIVANSHKSQLVDIVNNYYKYRGQVPRIYHSNIFRQNDLGLGGGIDPHHQRAFLKIQDGCNSFCSFCIIPYARGKSRSIPIKDLLQRIRELESKNFKEIVLTGVHIGDYQDEQYSLEDLIEFILDFSNIPRIRLTSLEPIEISDRLLKLFKNHRLCPHFHMSIQSANTAVLVAMKRKYGQKEVIEALAKIAQEIPHSFVGIDIIAGFPTETEWDFEDTLKVLENSFWDKLHVFPYSERRGTKAALMDQVPWETRKYRARILRELSLKRYTQKAYQQIGRNKDVLVLRGNKNFIGIARDYWPIVFSEPLGDQLINSEVTVNITGYMPQRLSNSEGSLIGKIVLNHNDKGL